MTQTNALGLGSGAAIAAAIIYSPTRNFILGSAEVITKDFLRSIPIYICGTFCKRMDDITRVFVRGLNVKSTAEIIQSSIGNEAYHYGLRFAAYSQTLVESYFTVEFLTRSTPKTRFDFSLAGLATLLSTAVGASMGGSENAEILALSVCSVAATVLTYTWRWKWTL